MNLYFWIHFSLRQRRHHRHLLMTMVDSQIMIRRVQLSSAHFQLRMIKSLRLNSSWLNSSRLNSPPINSSWPRLILLTTTDIITVIILVVQLNFWIVKHLRSSSVQYLPSLSLLLLTFLILQFLIFNNSAIKALTVIVSSGEDSFVVFVWGRRAGGWGRRVLDVVV